MSHKVIIESVGNVKGRIIEGIALTPAVSLNRNIYSIEAIDSAKNLGISLKADWEHTDEIIGSVVYSKGPNHSIMYRAEINTNRVIKEGVTKVSIEASVDEVVNSCNRKGCYNLIDGITFEGIGLTENPGVQTTTLNIIESYQDWKILTESHCEPCNLKIKEEEDIKSENERLKNEIKELKTCPTCHKLKKFEKKN